MDDQQRYRQRSLWLDGALARFAPRRRSRAITRWTSLSSAPATPGLWTAYALTLHDPSLRIAVVEAETVGYGSVGSQRRLRARPASPARHASTAAEPEWTT